jgi:hypothetical protein
MLKIFKKNNSPGIPKKEDIKTFQFLLSIREQKIVVVFMPST